MISLMWDLKQEATNGQTKQTNKLVDIDNRKVVTRGKGVEGRMQKVKGVKFMVMEGGKAGW